MRRNNSYVYPKTVREAIEGKRHYVISNEKLPSVTTILAATESPEKTAALARWREAKGEEVATRIVDEAAARGTAMHKILEKYIDESGYLDLTNIGKDAHNMAIRIIEQGLCNITEYYGTECTLYYPGLYAGSTDLVGIHKGEDLYETGSFIVHYFSTEKIKQLSAGFNILNIESFEEGSLPRKLFQVTLRKK